MARRGARIKLQNASARWRREEYDSLIDFRRRGRIIRRARRRLGRGDVRLYTPGSYWVNPPSPRTVDGRHADPWTGEVVEYDMSGAVVSSVEAEDESVDDGELSAAERAILADIEGL